MQYQSISIEPLLQLMSQANQLANDIYQTYLETDQISSQFKKDQSPVTQADLAVNRLLCQGLQQLYPDIPIISEENQSIDYQVRKHYPLYWCIDPIDGTKEFLNKNGEFTINIGLVSHQRSVLGLVSHPPENTIYYAIRNQGAWLLQEGKKKQLPLSQVNRQIPIIVCSRSHLNHDTQQFLEQFTDYQMISRGSSLKCLAVARGDADIYPRMNGSMEWDTCASQIIVEEAGAHMLQADSLLPLLYNKPNLLNPYFIVQRLDPKSTSV